MAGTNGSENSDDTPVPDSPRGQVLDIRKKMSDTPSIYDSVGHIAGGVMANGAAIETLRREMLRGFGECERRDDVVIEEVRAIRKQLSEDDGERGRLIAIVSKLEAAANESRSTMSSITNEVAETKQALTGLQTIGRFTNRNPGVSAVVTVVVTSLFHALINWLQHLH